MTERAFPMAVLERPFDEADVRRIVFNGRERTDELGRPIEYVAAPAVIERLNEAFGGAWSFEVPWQEVGEQFAAVRGRLAAWGEAKEQFGAAEIKRFGKDHSRAGQIIDIGNDLKAAASDALKKCASLFGVGLYLQDKEARARARQGAPPAGRIPRERAEALFALAKEKGFTREQLVERVERLCGGPHLSALTPAQAATLQADLEKGPPGSDIPF